MSILTTIFTAFLTAYVTFYISGRKNYNDVVAEERKKWRVNIKNTLNELDYSDADKVEKAITFFQLNLNPFDDADIAIIDQLIHLKENIKNEQVRIKDKKEIIRNVSYLLKHDWERQKHESSLFFMLTPVKNEPKRSVLRNDFFKERNTKLKRSVCCGRSCLYIERFNVIDI
ncbi:hypothetical protein [Morganella morganii]|uniref:hypothetical protein n=1 Tax=Morganella morganii TaxID=582 RepID=UPI0023674D58|nr:hypothetical protein [Morganella morganii]